jgi:hypothetical protein
MKHYRIINVGKGTLNISAANVEKISGILGGGSFIAADSNSFYIGTWWVEKASNKTSTVIIEEGDKIKGYRDNAQTVWVEGIVLIDGIVLPADLNTTNRFFKTNEKIKI